MQKNAKVILIFCAFIGNIYFYFTSTHAFANFSDEKQLYFDPQNIEVFGDLWQQSSLDEVKDRFPFFSKYCGAYPALNFGTVIKNNKYQIYRSKALGARGVEELFEFMKKSDLPLPDSVIFMNKEGYRSYWGGAVVSQYSHYFKGMHHFVFEEAQLFNEAGSYPEITFYHPLNSPVYVSGQDPLNELNSYRIDSLVDPEIKDYFAKDLEKSQIKNIIGTRSNFFYVLRLILENRKPVLFHCTGGLHRTGMMALALRYLQGGVWTKPFEQPITIFQTYSRYAHNNLKFRNLAEIEYYLHNNFYFRQKNLESMRRLAKQREFISLQKRYRDDLNEPSFCP